MPRLMELPMDTLLDILKRLPVKSVCCLRCVSKTLSDIALSPFFVDLHTRFLIATNAVAEAEIVLSQVTSFCESTGRRLMALESLNYDGSQGKLTLSAETLSTSDEVYYNAQFVFYNLICFKNHSLFKDLIGFKYPSLIKDGKCFLINPFSGEVLRIPTPEFGRDISLRYDCYGMGFDDKTSTYKIVCVSQIYNKTISESRVVAQLLVLGTSSWREMPIPSVLSRGKVFSTKSICAHGDMHWLFGEECDAGGIHLVSFDSKKEELYLTPIPIPIPAASPMPYLQLITLRESMAIVDTSQMQYLHLISSINFEIWVMKDYNKKEWKREYIINLQMMGSALEFKFHWAKCCEWEQGILFIDEECATSFFWDLKRASMKSVKCRNVWKKLKSCVRILSLKRSLITLKKFGNLVEEPESSSNYIQSLPISIKSTRGKFDRGREKQMRGTSFI